MAAAVRYRASLPGGTAFLDQTLGPYYYVLENERYCQPRVKGWVEVIR